MHEENKYKNLSNSLEKKEITESANLILELFSRDGNNFGKNLLLEGILPEPLQMDFDDHKDRLLSFCLSFLHATQNCESSIKSSLFLACSQLTNTIEMINTLNKSNISELYKDGLFDMPNKQMIHMLCVFLENQDRLMDIELMKKVSESSAVDLMEPNIADINTKNDWRISLTDNAEAGIEIVKLLIELLFYMGRKEIDKEYNPPLDISPYELPNIEKIHLLGLHRYSLNHLWEKVKYRTWKYERIQNSDLYYYFRPSNKNDFRLERAAIERSIYKDRKQTYSDFNDIHHIFKTQEAVSELIDLNNIMTLFQISNEAYIQCINGLWNTNNKHIEELVYINSNFLQNRYFGKNKNINFNMFLNCVYYLQVLGHFYDSRSHFKFDDSNREGYRFLTPVMNRDLIIKHFNSLFDYDQEIVTEMIDLLIFKPKKSQKDFADLFSQPLVYIGKKQVIFVPALTKQLHIVRMIEQQISLWDIKVSSKGYGFEEDIINNLQICPQLQVNTNKIVFDAFDGKPVEFDFIGMFEDKLLLIEIKCLRKQFSAKEYYLREKDVLYGVEQVNRRAKILMHDWDKVKQLVNIRLPNDPPNENDIKRIVCLNILDFTGKEIEGVRIIDDSMLVKYFLSGEVQALSINLRGAKVIHKESLWSKGYPTFDEFWDFLNMPIAVKGFYNSLEEHPRGIMRIKEEDPKLAIIDYVLTKSPFDYDFIKILDKRKKSKKKNAGLRNKKIEKKKKQDRKKQRRSK